MISPKFESASQISKGSFSDTFTLALPFSSVGANSFFKTKPALINGQKVRDKTGTAKLSKTVSSEGQDIMQA